ncbi:MAG: prepilin-type N-terminal cleavage/methylation domain-containing protein [Deltaproteobacteria bacterium]|nr:prepilin-type N-terminal cleavage/methylation domain-containing protein [Deltaproteobacteria bacterium]
MADGPPPGPRRGFSLLELIISIGLLSLLLSLIFGSLYQLSQGADSLQDSLEERQELRILLKLIGDDLLSMQWLEQYHSGNDGRATGLKATFTAVGSGRFSSISFHAAQPARFFRTLARQDDPGVHEVGWEVKENRDGVLELVRREDFYLDDDMGSGGVEVPVAEGMLKFQVSLLPSSGASSSSGGAATTETIENWADEWRSWEKPKGQRLPKAVKLILGRKTKSGIELEETLEINLMSSG